jgi:hypothetical protein
MDYISSILNPDISDKYLIQTQNLLLILTFQTILTQKYVYTLKLN